jgi:hypothetical protein
VNFISCYGLIIYMTYSGSETIKGGSSARSLTRWLPGNRSHAREELTRTVSRAKLARQLRVTIQ